MTDIICVIGSGYGDEGKGLMTDYHTSKNLDALVIRSNGGAQAGHTAQTPDGKRHIFSHFGSGSFNGNSTYLSDYFVTNPLLFRKEHYQLLPDISPNVYIDTSSRITTPYDMLLNQQKEFQRGSDKHGSVGVGFNETIQRCENFYDISMGDIEIMNNDNIFKWCEEIRTIYIPSIINMNEVNNEFHDLIFNDDIIYDFIVAIRYMLDNVTITDSYGLIEKLDLYNRPIVFEGAQGLLLDRDYGFFPHVTNSNCGMKNMQEIISRINGKHNVTVNYVTRAYTTRHGAGPLDYESPYMSITHNIVDETNIHNDWQGSLRFAPFNKDVFDSITSKDFANYAPKNAKKIITMTCIDQLGSKITSIEENKIKYYDNVTNFCNNINADMLSFGPTRMDIKDDNKK